MPETKRWDRDAVLAKAIKSMKAADKATSFSNAEYHVRESAGWVKIAELMEEGTVIET
jgi:hypothetical protein